MRCDNFLLKAFVRRVKRRIAIHIVRFCRSTKEVLIWSGSGSPVRTLDITPEMRGGWQQALGEAERQIGQHKRKIFELTNSIKIMREKIAAGEPWPE